MAYCFSGILLLVSCTSYNRFADQDLFVTFLYYTEQRYDWDTGIVGVLLAVLGLILSLVQVLLMKPLMSLLGPFRLIVIAIFLAFLSQIGTVQT